MKVFVAGASRGIGLEFVRQYRADGAAVRATARDEAGLARLRALGAEALALDIADAESCSRLAWQLDGLSFDVAIVNAGLFGPDAAGVQAPAVADFDAVMHTNVLGAMRVLEQLAELLAPQARVALLSSGMASIGQRSSPDHWLYRASKAALNSVAKDAALALAGRASCIAISPGWVRTDMGGSAAPLSVEQSVGAMRRTIAGLKPADSGRFLDHDGTPIPW
ncbi:SDR family oxidoreductase [uncultured Methylibium sp.]|uniref:SDR family oxidoreductase n=1 Tax=uncultured Methylibium sp. TaxID=381093 RepID=UPI0025DFE2E0|nr:SDR family oxidoreductase [uncultured Methylibium sp.]